jgi:hypothetical protein
MLLTFLVRSFAENINSTATALIFTADSSAQEAKVGSFTRFVKQCIQRYAYTQNI